MVLQLQLREQKQQHFATHRAKIVVDATTVIHNQEHLAQAIKYVTHMSVPVQVVLQLQLREQKQQHFASRIIQKIVVDATTVTLFRNQLAQANKYVTRMSVPVQTV